MKLVLKLLLLLLFVTGCKTKHLQIEKSEERQKEVRKSEKDSVFEQKMQAKVTELQLTRHELTELELITEKDSTGQSKMLEFERIRSPSGEKIIVRGGSLKLKTTHQTADKITKKDTLQVNNTSVRTNIEEYKNTENKSFSKQKEVKQSGLKWLWLTMIVSGILILVLVFLQWKFKIFKGFPAVFARFKKYLNKV